MDIKTRNHVKVFGDGDEILLFAHGFGASQEMWRYVAPSFSSEYQVVLFDHVGSGKSDIAAYSAEKYQDLQGYKQDLIELIDWLAKKPVTVIAHSVSGMISLLASLDRPELFKKLIMIGPSPRYINDEGYQGGFTKADVDELLNMMEMNFVGWASYLAPIAIHQENNSIFAEELKTSFTSTDVEVMIQFARATFYSDYRELLPKVHTPVLVMQCSDDSIVPERVGQYLADHLPNGTIVKMEAKGHYPQLSHPEETITIIKEYLERQGSNSYA